MSFFGFDTSRPRDPGHNTSAAGFGTAPDPFASLPHGQEIDDDDEGIDFEDTYDGLGEQLDDEDDAFNDATFGGSGGASLGPQTAAPKVGKDYDFFGQTAKVSTAIDEEQMRFSRQQKPSKPLQSKPSPPKRSSQPYKSGYEAYKDPGHMSGLQVNASIWGSNTAGQTSMAQDDRSRFTAALETLPEPTVAPKMEMLSLEEVEAQLAAQKRAPATVTSTSFGPPSKPENQQKFLGDIQNQPYNHHHAPPSQNQMYHQHLSQHQQRPSMSSQYELPGQSMPATYSEAPQVLQRRQPPPQPGVPTQDVPPRQILQNPDRRSANIDGRIPDAPSSKQHHRQKPSMGPSGAPIITHPQQFMHLSEEQRNAYLAEDAKRAKRNHKIFLMSRDNGFMTPQDKNFVTRVQLSQLMTATGNINSDNQETVLAEDFYYQVHSHIQGGRRQNPEQPLSNFAQTYLFQTGNRHGLNRRNNRGDNHMQRMEMQVQRAVESAKAKPKNPQLVIEGSLGKIAFSNSKTPKPLLNIKRNDGSDIRRPSSAGSNTPNRKSLPQSASTSDKKTILRNIENVYVDLMKLEDHERRSPSTPADDTDSIFIRQVVDWKDTKDALVRKLWADSKIMDPIGSEGKTLHPFIAFLSYPKGKKAIPRIYRQIDQGQRLTIMTIIMIHLNVLDVIRSDQPSDGRSASLQREDVELFLQAVMPNLFALFSDAAITIVVGALSLVLARADMAFIARTKVGLAILTMLLSRAELIKQGESPAEDEWQQWLDLYNRLFDAMEPILAGIFPSSINEGQDMYVWQFLASLGIGASPEQQQRLVLAVKDRVMETVQQSKTLPPEMASQRLSNVNLFMRAIGLDVDLLG